MSARGPILAQENIEKRIPTSQSLLSEKVDYYLRVKGDSMVDVGILEEDLIGVKKTNDIKVNPSVDELNFEGVCVGLLRNLS